MTAFQADLYTEFSGKILCLDSTYRTNQYKHKLVTTVVPDEFHNGMTLQRQLRNSYLCTYIGCLVVWLISNREDEATLTVFFKAVKLHCPEASIKTLMTDDDKQPVTKCINYNYGDVAKA